MKKTPISEEEERKMARMGVTRQRQLDEAQSCDPDISCPTCQIPLVPEHAHMTCPQCHYRDSCCF